MKRAHGLYEQKSPWARGYFVSTIGLDEMIIRRYVKHQHHHNQMVFMNKSHHGPEAILFLRLV
ncbi:hypothetical protein H6784_04615 [Candidatus Nomurabacteria bacterium]|nr:hypothetical protein [Candidatus Nomurabacteria bacterium]